MEGPGFGDMMWDSDRNAKYREAIVRAVQTLQPEHVLDIGTGMGLLSLFAAEGGARHITACENNEAMLEVAKQVLPLHRCPVRLVEKYSTDMTAGEGGDMPGRADLVVMELFDTELIGESVIPTMIHASEHLLTADATVVPSKADVFVQAVQSDCLSRWHRWSRYPRRCRGVRNPFDIHVDRLRSQLRLVSEPCCAFAVDFSKPEPNQETVVRLQGEPGERVDCILLWWTCHMFDDIRMTTEPEWHEGAYFRDHWLQAVYPLAEPMTLDSSGRADVLAHQDEFGFWFDPAGTPEAHTPPTCTCGLHLATSARRIWMLGDDERTSRYQRALEAKWTPSTQLLLCLGDGPLLALLAAELGGAEATVVVLQSSRFACQSSASLVADILPDFKGLFLSRDQTEALEAACEGHSELLLVAEPYSSDGLLVWDDFLDLWTGFHTLPPTIRERTVLGPQRARLCGVLVMFEHYHKLHNPAPEAEGYELVVPRELKAAVEMEPISSWEYHHTALSEPVTVFDVDLRQPAKPLNATVPVTIGTAGELNGLILWMEYQLTDDICVSSAPADGNMPNPSRQVAVVFRTPLETAVQDGWVLEVTLDPQSHDLDVRRRRA